VSKNFQHPGRVLGHFIKFLLVQKNNAAKHIGVSRATLFRIIGEEGRITVGVAMRLEQAFNVPALYWLQRQAEYDIEQARRSGAYAKIGKLKSVVEARDALALAENESIGTTNEWNVMQNTTKGAAPSRNYQTL